MNRSSRQRGFTLVELVVSMVIVAIALTGWFTMMNQSVGASADPMIREQCIAIAEAYMEEILSKGYNPGPGNTRTTYDDVQDYAAIGTEVPTDQYGAHPFGAGGNGYTVTVVVGAAAAIGGQNMLPITVTVNHVSGASFVLSGYRGSWGF